MLVTLVYKNRLTTTTLPEKVSGQYWLKDIDEFGNTHQIMSIEGIDGQWYLKSNKVARIIGSNNESVKNQILSPLKTCNILLRNSGEKAFIFTEPITLDRQKFIKVVVNENTEVKIGRAEYNTIVFDNSFVSSHHASLTFSHNQWTITDLDSTNGTFVNGCRSKSKALVVGDTVFIMGLKIIIGTNFFAFNNPDGRVRYKNDEFRPYVLQLVDEQDEDDEYDDSVTFDYFYRSPRFKRGIETLEIKVDPPPSNAIGEEMPLMFLLGPSITMGMAFLTSAAFTLYNAMSRGGFDFCHAYCCNVFKYAFRNSNVAYPFQEI